MTDLTPSDPSSTPTEPAAVEAAAGTQVGATGAAMTVRTTLSIGGADARTV